MYNILKISILLEKNIYLGGKKTIQGMKKTHIRSIGSCILYQRYFKKKILKEIIFFKVRQSLCSEILKNPIHYNFSLNKLNNY